MGLLLAVTAVLPVAAIAQPAPERVEVKLTSFAFTPSTVTLTHGRAYVLALRNDAGGGHNFEAPDFFAASAVDPVDKAKIKGGKVELRGDAATEIRLVAPSKPGSYKLRCSHFLHSSFGMTGTIEVR